MQCKEQHIRIANSGQVSQTGQKKAAFERMELVYRRGLGSNHTREQRTFV
jgi:hypothetical protein